MVNGRKGAKMPSGLFGRKEFGRANSIPMSMPMKCATEMNGLLTLIGNKNIYGLCWNCECRQPFWRFSQFFVIFLVLVWEL
jgi:hypothetical protein